VRVLVIDDDPGEADLLGARLGADCDRAGTLADGMRMAASGAYDLVFLDRSLPDSAPSETVQRWAMSSPGVQTYIYTGSDDPQTFREAAEWGLAALSKLSRPEDARAVLAGLRERPAAGDQNAAGAKADILRYWPLVVALVAGAMAVGEARYTLASQIEISERRADRVAQQQEELTRIKVMLAEVRADVKHLVERRR